MLVPEAVESRIDRADLCAHLRVVPIGEPMPELRSLLAQALDLLVDLLDGSHGYVNGRHARDIPGESSALAEKASPDLHCGEGLADPVADGSELERLASHLAEELVGRGSLALGPQLAQERARFAAREPCVAEALPEVGTQLGLERPGAEV